MALCRNICRRVKERGSELTESQLQDYYHGRVNGSLEGHRVYNLSLLLGEEERSHMPRRLQPMLDVLKKLQESGFDFPHLGFFK